MVIGDAPKSVIMKSLASTSGYLKIAGNAGDGSTWDEHVAEIALPALLLYILRKSRIANGRAGEHIALHCCLRIRR